MIVTWESEKERILRHMNISPKRKLEWLWQMNEFVRKTSSPSSVKIRRKLRETRSIGY
jgi:hypothetical protein